MRRELILSIRFLSLSRSTCSLFLFSPSALPQKQRQQTDSEKSPAYLEEVTEPRYIIEVSSIPKKKTGEGGKEEAVEGGPSSPPSSSSSAAAAASSSAAKSQRTVSLADRAGRPFECTIPAVPSPEDEDFRDGVSGGEEKAAGANNNNNNNNNSDGSDPSPASLLRSLEGACLYRIEDSWWTYELCFERHVRQFHREGPGGASAEFWLGKWGGGGEGGSSSSGSSGSGSSGSSTQYNVSISRDRSSPLGEASFVSSTYGGGDPCDLLAGRPRRAEVRYVCHERPAPTAAPPQPQQQPPPPQGGPSSSPPPTPPAAAAAANLVQPPPNVILSAKELSTCSYEVVVGVDALCRHRGFRAAEPAMATISCRPVE